MSSVPLLTPKAKGVPVRRWQQRCFAAPQMGFGDCTTWPETVVGKFTAGAEGLVVQSIARKENYGTICSKYYHKKNYQIRTDKYLKTCIALKTSGKASWIFSSRLVSF